MPWILSFNRGLNRQVKGSFTPPIPNLFCRYSRNYFAKAGSSARLSPSEHVGLRAESLCSKFSTLGALYTLCKYA